MTSFVPLELSEGRSGYSFSATSSLLKSVSQWRNATHGQSFLLQDKDTSYSGAKSSASIRSKHVRPLGFGTSISDTARQCSKRRKRGIAHQKPPMCERLCSAGRCHSTRGKFEAFHSASHSSEVLMIANLFGIHWAFVFLSFACHLQRSWQCYLVFHLSCL